MIGFIKGIIHAYKENFVLIDVNGIGYRINFYHPEALSIGKEIIIYTYQHVREDEISLYGFLSLEEYDIFMKLISVKGLGPKIASNILGVATPNRLIEAIENDDIDFIKKMPGVGNKTASQVILDLKGKLIEVNKTIDDPNSKDVLDALKAMGYKASEVKPIIDKLKSENLSVDEYLKKALSMLAR